jgi:hypothetical protein
MCAITYNLAANLPPHRTKRAAQAFQSQDDWHTKANASHTKIDKLKRKVKNQIDSRKKTNEKKKRRTKTNLKTKKDEILF